MLLVNCEWLKDQADFEIKVKSIINSYVLLLQTIFRLSARISLSEIIPLVTVVVVIQR